MTSPQHIGKQFLEVYLQQPYELATTPKLTNSVNVQFVIWAGTAESKRVLEVDGTMTEPVAMKACLLAMLDQFGIAHR